MTTIIDLDETDPANALDRIRRGDHVYMRGFHLLASRVKRTNHKPRDEFWTWLGWLVERGVILVDTDNGIRADTRELAQIVDVLRIAAHAIEVVTRGARGRARQIAQENGRQSKGRPRKDRQKNRELAQQVYLNPAIAGVRLRQSLRRVGWSYQMAWQEFGPRYGAKS